MLAPLLTLALARDRLDLGLRLKDGLAGMLNP